MIPKWACWYAVDNDGHAYYYEKKPWLDGFNGCFSTEDTKDLCVHAGKLTTGEQDYPNWQESRREIRKPGFIARLFVLIERIRRRFV